MVRGLNLCLAVVLWVTSAMAQEQTGAVFYVAANGNDQWSGILAEANAEKTNGPLATITRAREVIREAKKKDGLPKGATVFVRAGTYFLADGLELRPEDSGAAEGRIVYRAYENEKAILVGGRPITGFVPHKGEILKADLKAQGFSEFPFRQLFYNGKRQHLARYPNFDPDAPVCGGWAFIPGDVVQHYGKPIEETVEERRTLHVRPEYIHNWAHPEEGEVFLHPNHNWWNHIVGVASVDKEKGLIHLKPDNGFENFLGDRRFGMKPGCRFYVHNLLEELDAPGEWYLDKANRTLYFWPPGTLEGAVVAAPTTKAVVSLWKASYITIQGFTIECADEFGVNAWQSEHCLIARNTIRNIGGFRGSAVSLNGGTSNGAVGNDIYDVGGNGISLSGGDRETLTPCNNYADNNYIHHIGILYKAASGLSCDGVGNRMSRNLVHDTPRQGIRWHGSDHIIELNHVRHTNTEISDTAGINACNSNWTMRGTILRYNYIHDTIGFGKNRDGEWVSPYYCWGIYLDNFTSGTTVYGNICARIVLGGPFIHGGRDNVIENNFLIDGKTAQMWYNGAANLPECKAGAKGRVDDLMKFGKLPVYQKYPGLVQMFQSDENEWNQMAGNKFLRNVCCYSDPAAKLYFQRELRAATTESDYNLIWTFGNPITVGMDKVPPEKQWEEWKKLGFDAHSIVADPLFVNAKNDDFCLRPESPAHKLGIKQIPVEKIGPYDDPLRASWPIVEAEGVREHPLKLDLMPKPPPKPAKANPYPRNTTPFMTNKIGNPPQVDGVLSPGEWPEAAMAMNQTPQRLPIEGPACSAQVCWDDQCLYVAVAVPIKDVSKLVRTEKWGPDDAMEVCFQDLSGEKPGPIFVLHGFLSGLHESVTLAKAPADVAENLGKAVRYAVKVGEKEWTCEWAIPIAAAGITPKAGLKLAFNLAVHRNETGQWICWVGPMGSAYRLEEAGYLVLE
ncbi:MAG: sugar-binding protein [Planctomycetota bacterium]